MASKPRKAKKRVQIAPEPVHGIVGAEKGVARTQCGQSVVQPMGEGTKIKKYNTDTVPGEVSAWWSGITCQPCIDIMRDRSSKMDCKFGREHRWKRQYSGATRCYIEVCGTCKRIRKAVTQ